jgi:predicted transcriptional regulator
MKTAVSIPDDVFEEVERLAQGMNRSRSHVYSRALAEFVARHSPDRVTEAMNRALEEIDEPMDEFIRTASRRVLERSEW